MLYLQTGVLRKRREKLLFLNIIKVFMGIFWLRANKPMKRIIFILKDNTVPKGIGIVIVSYPRSYLQKKSITNSSSRYRKSFQTFSRRKYGFDVFFLERRSPLRCDLRTRLVMRWDANLSFSLSKTTHKHVSKNIRFRFWLDITIELSSRDPSHVRFLIRRFWELCSRNREIL